jgi:hypothetical protein
MKKNKKSRIDIYTNLYGVDLVVANKYTTIEELRKDYTFYDGVELTEEIMDCMATTSKVRRKSDNRYCMLVKYNRESKIKDRNPKLEFVNTISHEAAHVAIDIYQYIDQDLCPCSSEPFCYLVGWVTECIYKTLQSK